MKSAADKAHEQAAGAHAAVLAAFNAKNEQKMKMEQEELSARLEYKAKSHAKVQFGNS